VKKLKRAHKQEIQWVIIEMGRGADKAGNTMGGRREFRLQISISILDTESLC